MSTTSPSNAPGDDLQHKLAQVISDSCEDWLKDSAGMAMPQFVAKRLTRLVELAQADILRETADDIHFLPDEPAGSSAEYRQGMDDGASQLFEQMRERAARIERGMSAHG